MIETAKGETKGMENVENERKLDFPVGKWFVFIDGRQLYISDIGTVDGAFFLRWGERWRLFHAPNGNQEPEIRGSRKKNRPFMKENLEKKGRS